MMVLTVFTLLAWAFVVFIHILILVNPRTTSTRSMLISFFFIAVGLYIIADKLVILLGL